MDASPIPVFVSVYYDMPLSRLSKHKQKNKISTAVVKKPYHIFILMPNKQSLMPNKQSLMPNKQSWRDLNPQIRVFMST